MAHHRREPGRALRASAAQAQDEFALRSQQLAAGRACARAAWPRRLCPRPAPASAASRSKSTADEHPRPEVTLESLARLKPRFKEGGTVTPGNASGINDAAAAVVLAGGAFATAHSLKPLGRLVSWAVVGVEPEVMGIGPAPAIRAALRRADLTLGEIDLIEINEAFAAQYLAVEKELKLDRDRVNVNGGAIALGHPLAPAGRGSRSRCSMSYGGGAAASGSPRCALAAARASPRSSSASSRARRPAARRGRLSPR